MPIRIRPWSRFMAVITFVAVAVVALAAGVGITGSVIIASAIEIAVMIMASRRATRDEVLAALAAHPGEYLDAKRVARIIRVTERRNVSPLSVSSRLEDMEWRGEVDFVRSSTKEATTYSYCLRLAEQQPRMVPHPAI